MLALKPSHPASRTFPWQEGRACHQDRAMGLELELIELVHQRDVAAVAGGSVGAIDEQIDEVMADLAVEAAAPVLT